VGDNQNWATYMISKNGLNKEEEFFGYGNPIINYMGRFFNFTSLDNKCQSKVFLSDNE